MAQNSRIKFKVILFLGIGIFIALAVGFLNYIPFYAPSYFIWGGIIFVFIGLFGIILPIRIIGLKTRKRSTLVTCIATMVVFITIMWPPALSKSDKPRQRIDDFMPQFQCVEYHEEWVDIPADKLQEAILQVSLSDIPAVIVLFKLRFMFSDNNYFLDDKPFLDFNPDSGFLILDDSDPAERVYGMVGKPWEEDVALDVRTADQFMAFNDPENIKVAFNFRVEDKGDRGSLISTETRGLGNDVNSRKIFARYWRVIYPGSSIIRRVWLDAIIRMARTI